MIASSCQRVSCHFRHRTLLGHGVRTVPCIYSVAPGGGAAGSSRPAQPVYYPGIEEESEVSHDAFHRAFEDAKPVRAQIPGLQGLAAAIWERRRLIPSSHDPLEQIFKEFDSDNDGVLAAPEIASALQSRGVTIDAEQVQWLINTYEEERACVLPCFDTHTISKEEWPNFVYSLTICDLHATEDTVSHSSLDSS